MRDKGKRNARLRAFHATPIGKISQCLNGIKLRCYYPTHPAYKYYGGRGIQNFLTREDLKVIWDRDCAAAMKKPSIDRIDNDGDYTFDNCRFIEQGENTRRRKLHHVTKI